MKRGQKGRVKSRFWFSVWSWLSVLHMPAANLCVCDLERLPQDIHNLCQLNTERDRERESGHSADLSTSPEEISSTQGAFTLPKALTSNYLFFFLSNTACNQARKQALALFVWWVWTLHSSAVFLLSTPHIRPFSFSFHIPFSDCACGLFLIHSHHGRI